MSASELKLILNFPVRPFGLLYKVARTTSRIIHKLGLLKPNRSHQYIYTDEAVLILTPLSGSSSVRFHNRDRVKTRYEARPRVFVLWRDNTLRMQTLYNKKILNPASLFKVIQLVTLGDLDPRHSVDDFLDYLERMVGDYRKDKHLFLNEEVLHFHEIDEEKVEKIDISHDSEILQGHFGLRVSSATNRTAQKAVYRNPVTFTRDQTERIARIECRFKEKLLASPMGGLRDST